MNRPLKIICAVCGASPLGGADLVKRGGYLICRGGHTKVEREYFLANHKQRTGTRPGSPIRRRRPLPSNSFILLALARGMNDNVGT